MKARFQILRREVRSWQLYDVVSIANTLVILHNDIVSMQQNGGFRDEAGGENVITEFLNDHGQAKTEAENEYKENRRCAQSEIGMDWEEHVVRWIANELQYTYFESSVELEAELIRYHAEKGHDVGLPYHEGQILLGR